VCLCPAATTLTARPPSTCMTLKHWLPGQDGSEATMMTRDCSGNLTSGSRRRTNPFSTTPTTATGRGCRACASMGRGWSLGEMPGSGRCGSEANCSSRALRRSLLRSRSGIGMVVDSQSVGVDNEDWRFASFTKCTVPPASPPVAPCGAGGPPSRPNHARPIGLTPDAGGPPSRPNHALACVVTSASTAYRRSAFGGLPTSDVRGRSVAHRTLLSRRAPGA
jgi:hypothetical protein